MEIFGFGESLILYRHMLAIRTYPLPEIPDDAWPDVDIFVATYNEPPALLRKTLNGCKHLKYPDPAKVHIWLCDDHRRPEMRALAEEMGVEALESELRKRSIFYNNTILGDSYYEMQERMEEDSIPAGYDY